MYKVTWLSVYIHVRCNLTFSVYTCTLCNIMYIAHALYIHVWCTHTRLPGTLTRASMPTADSKYSHMFLFIYVGLFLIRKCTYICVQLYIHLQCTHTCLERWGAGVETQKNVRGEVGGWGRVPFNEPYAPSLSTIYDGA